MKLQTFSVVGRLEEVVRLPDPAFLGSPVGRLERAHLVEDRVAPQLGDGSLVRALDDWCAPFDGYYLYYFSRRQPSAAFTLMLKALRYRA